MKPDFRLIIIIAGALVLFLFAISQSAPPEDNYLMFNPIEDLSEVLRR